MPKVLKPTVVAVVATGETVGVGQFQKPARANAMSAFPLLATRQRTSLVVRFVPKAEVPKLLLDHLVGERQ